MGKTQTLPDYPRGLDFEQVWAALMENRELQKETDRQMKDTDRQLKETDRQIKEMGKRFGEFNNRIGEVVEYMVAPNLQEKFKKLGFVFQRINNNTKFADEKNDIFFEVDVLLENGEKAMLVEVKTKLTTKYIDDHVDRLFKMREYADLHGDKRSFLGAVASTIIPDNIKKYAFSKGFFVVEPSGETFNIIAPRGKPKEW